MATRRTSFGSSAFGNSGETQAGSVQIANPDQPLTVTHLNRQARIALEQKLNLVWVTGELSNFARPRSGHWYFTLKDDQAQVRCAMFANRNRSVQMQPADGQLVLLRGRVSLYEGRGDYQVIVDHMQLAGAGALQQAYERLKLKLNSEGLFDQSSKQPLPDFPQHVAVVTSPTGAALRDVLAVWRRRYPGLDVTLVPTQVQGDSAEAELVSAIQRADALDADAILLTRGGGSLEDLWSFNLEAVARAVAACATPVVSAVGHEIDVTIADLAADLRAPTPSAGAELLVPDLAELSAVISQYERALNQEMSAQLRLARMHVRNLRLSLPTPQQYLQQAMLKVDDLANRSHTAITHRLSIAKQRSQHSRSRLAANSPTHAVQQSRRSVESLRHSLSHQMQHIQAHKRQRSEALSRMLHGVSPLPTIARGYAVVRNEAQTVVSSVAELEPNAQVKAYLRDGTFTATVNQVTPDETLTPDSQGTS